jgi:uncharacterized membrane protein YeaQ/YmgE (transglycosylase-associated protein family)
LVGWLAGWLTGWPVGWLVGWLAGWLVEAGSCDVAQAGLELFLLLP